MSATYSIACRDCRKHLWIAQGRGGGTSSVLYLGEEKTMEALKAFLYAHVGHHLTFGDNCNGEIGEFEEIEP